MRKRDLLEETILDLAEILAVKGYSEPLNKIKDIYLKDYKDTTTEIKAYSKLLKIISNDITNRLTKFIEPEINKFSKIKEIEYSIFSKSLLEIADVIYSEQPVSNNNEQKTLPKKKDKIEQFINAYIKFKKNDSGKDKFTQKILAKYTDYSQSTWSRALRNKKFIDMIYWTCEKKLNNKYYKLEYKQEALEDALLYLKDLLKKMNIFY